MKKAERAALAQLIREVLRTELRAAGIVPSAATTNAEESMSSTCPQSESKDPIPTEKNGAVDWYSLGAECGADLARRARRPLARSPRGPRALQSGKAV